MTVENYTTEELLDFFEEQVSCDTYCPVKCTHLQSEFSTFDLRAEILRRFIQLENDLLYETNYSGLRAT